MQAVDGPNSSQLEWHQIGVRTRRQGYAVKVEVVEGVAALCRLPSILVLQVVDVDAQQALLVSPGLLDLIGDPLAARRIRADQNNRDGCSVELSVNPSLDSSISALLDGFPVVV
jgi:hypothetical protein